VTTRWPIVHPGVGAGTHWVTLGAMSGAYLALAGPGLATRLTPTPIEIKGR